MALTEDELKEVETIILGCRVKVKTEIRDTMVEVQSLSEKVEAIENHLEKTLKKHELQRSSFNESMEAKIDELSKWFKEHDNNEMTKYEEILDSIKALTTTLEAVINETKQNSNYISKKAHEDNIEDEINKRLTKINKPKQELWNKVKMTVVTVITVGTLGALGTGILFVYDLYKKMGGE